MARKTTGSSTPQNKKVTSITEGAAAQAAPVVQAVPEVKNVETLQPEIRKTVVTANGASQINADLNNEIRQRAYELFLERKGAPGDPARDWITAEREVRARHAAPAAPKEIAFAASRRQG